MAWTHAHAHGMSWVKFWITRFFRQFWQTPLTSLGVKSYSTLGWLLLCWGWWVWFMFYRCVQCVTWSVYSSTRLLRSGKIAAHNHLHCPLTKTVCVYSSLFTVRILTLKYYAVGVIPDFDQIMFQKTSVLRPPLACITDLAIAMNLWIAYDMSPP